MFIRLFIKTTYEDKAEIVIKYLMSCINEDNIRILKQNFTGNLKILQWLKLG